MAAHFGELVDLVEIQALRDVTDSILQSDYLLVCHIVGIDVFPEVSSLVSYIILVHTPIIKGEAMQSVNGPASAWPE